LIATAILCLFVVSAFATFHLMQIEQVIAGVDGDNTVQAVQLRMRGSFQNLVQNSRLVARDASGANPVVVSTPGSSVANHGAGVRVLIASPNFAGATTPTASPDFTMDNLIPASYLAAGSLTFENSAGTIVYWRLSWGGGSYTGSNGGSTTNDLDGDFGPPFAGPLPSSDTQAVLFQGSATAMSTTNAADYALSGSNAVFTNNAGQSFTVESTVSAVGPVANEDRLGQNRPNPFNPSTEIVFSLANDGRARLGIYDVRGRLVATLADAHFDAGPHRMAWDGRDESGAPVASGVYFYRLTSASGDQTRKMVLTK
jgi:hypothetical protein